MFCTKCGKELPEDTRFCPSCGQQVGESVKEQIIYTKSLKEPKSRAVAAAFCIVLGLIGIHDFYMEKGGHGLTKIIILVLLGWMYAGVIINAIWCLMDLVIIANKYDDCFYTEDEIKRMKAEGKYWCDK